MDARIAIQQISIILFIVAGACGGAVYAGHVHIYTGDFNLPIPEPNSEDPCISKGWMADAIIKIEVSYIIHDIDVGINLTHTNVFDLQLFLQSPSEKRICLNMYNVEKDFFKGQNYTNTIFDDEADTPIEDANAPFTGRFRPLEPYKLSKFDDENTYGSWHLQICDRFWYDTGTFNHFELMITAPEPASAILMSFGAIMLKLFRPRRSH